MAPHSSTLAWKIPWTEEAGGLQSMGSLRVGHSWATSLFHFSLSCIGEGTGNPLQCSCLENPRDRGAWWASIYGVAQSWTRLKQLSSSRSRRSKRNILQESPCPWGGHSLAGEINTHIKCGEKITNNMSTTAKKLSVTNKRPNAQGTDDSGETGLA